MDSRVFLVNEAIDDYIGRGWSIIPIKPGDKRPLVRWDEFQHRRPTVEEVHVWFPEWSEAGIGIVTGPFPASSCSISISGTAAMRAWTVSSSNTIACRRPWNVALEVAAGTSTSLTLAGLSGTRWASRAAWICAATADTWSRRRRSTHRASATRG